MAALLFTAITALKVVLGRKNNSSIGFINVSIGFGQAIVFPVFPRGHSWSMGVRW